MHAWVRLWNSKPQRESRVISVKPFPSVYEHACGEAGVSCKAILFRTYSEDWPGNVTNHYRPHMTALALDPIRQVLYIVWGNDIYRQHINECVRIKRECFRVPEIASSPPGIVDIYLSYIGIDVTPTLACTIITQPTIDYIQSIGIHCDSQTMVGSLNDQNLFVIIPEDVKSTFFNRFPRYWPQGVTGVVALSNGNFLLSTAYSGTIWVYSVSTGVMDDVHPYASVSFNTNRGNVYRTWFSCIDHSDNVYVCDNIDDMVYRMPAGTKRLSPFLTWRQCSDLRRPSSIVYDGRHDFYILTETYCLLRYCPRLGFERVLETITVDNIPSTFTDNATPEKMVNMVMDTSEYCVYVGKKDRLFCIQLKPDPLCFASSVPSFTP